MNKLAKINSLKVCNKENKVMAKIVIEYYNTEILTEIKKFIKINFKKALIFEDSNNKKIMVLLV